MQRVSWKVPLTTCKTQLKNEKGVMQVQQNVTESDGDNAESHQHQKQSRLTTSDGKTNNKMKSS
jgi:hypothetical protein